MARILRDRAIYLWDLYSERYRTLPEEYEKTLEEARLLKITQNRISNQTKREYPKIEFLDIEDRKDAEEYLGKKTDSEISALIHTIELMVSENYSYKTYVTAVADHKYRIKAKGVSKRKYALAAIGENSLSNTVLCQRTIGTPTDDVFGIK